MAEAKSLEVIYKSHLENTCKLSLRSIFFLSLPLLHTGPCISANVDSARGNVAGTFVNTFVNDKLIVTAEEGSSWIYRNKDHGPSEDKVSSSASLNIFDV